MEKKPTAKAQFLKDLQADPDYRRHRENASWSLERYTEFGGYYNAASGTFRTAHVDNDFVLKSRRYA